VAQKAPHDVLSECLERWESSPAGAEELLAQHPKLRAELDPLLHVAAQLRPLSRVRAPERLRRDPLWRRGLAPAAQTTSHTALPSLAAAHATAPTARLEPSDALALALDRWEQGEPGVEAVLAEHPEVQPLVELAVELWTRPPVQAPARLRQDPLWRRAVTPAGDPTAPVSLPLWAAARREDAAGAPAALLGTSSRTHRKRVIRTLSRLAAGVSGAGLALLLAGGLATSTATSLPDEPLYPVKRLVEDAQLAVAPPQARLEIRMQRAQERMKETREMVERGGADVVASLATDYVREVDAVRTELHNPQTQAPAPEQVGRVITRLEANEQMLGAIVERVPEQARPSVARAVEVSRPESVATSEMPVTGQAPAAVAVPAAPEPVAPAAVAPPAASEPPAPAEIVPAAPKFGASGPASVALPGRVQAPQSATGSAPSQAPARVSVPGGASAAPAILPSTGGATAPQQAPASTVGGASGRAAGGAGSITGTGPSAGAPDSTAGAPNASASGAPSSITSSAPSMGTAGSTMSAPSMGAPSGAGSITSGGASAGPAPSSNGAPSSGAATAPASVTSGAQSATAAGSTNATTGGAAASGASSTQRAPSFDAPPAQATPVPPAPTPVYQLLPPAPTPTRATP
jgi:hypothetical protein